MEMAEQKYIKLELPCRLELSTRAAWRVARAVMHYSQHEFISHKYEKHPRHPPTPHWNTYCRFHTHSPHLWLAVSWVTQGRMSSIKTRPLKGWDDSKYRSLAHLHKKSSVTAEIQWLEELRAKQNKTENLIVRALISLSWQLIPIISTGITK